jgi:hypothetical protein
VNDVKKNQLTKGLMAAFMLTSGAVIAGADYPAADFQPKVLYNNPDYKESAPAPSAAKSAPAPKAAASEMDPNFPAANFQPKVVFNDSGYKHSSAAPTSPGGVSSSSKTTAASAAVEVIQAEKEASSDFSMIGLIGLALVGFLLFNKKSSGSAGSTAAYDDYSNNGDATGVEKYLEKIGANKTGVAKYLEKQGTTSTTGVARYMAKQIVKDREAAAARATGVEKYLRDKV